MPNIRGRYVKNVSPWRKIGAVGWSRPDDSEIRATVRLDMSEALPYVQEASEHSGIKVTVTHLVVKAIAETLRRHPHANGYVRKGRAFEREGVDVSVLVALTPADTGEMQRADLTAALIQEADKKSLVAIASELQGGVRGLRRGKRDPLLGVTKQMFRLMPPFFLRRLLRLFRYLEYDRNISLRRVGLPHEPFGSAMITSIAMFGLEEAYAPIPPFSAVPALLSLGQVHDEPAVRDGKLTVRPIMRVGATIDHRFIDGYQGGVLARTFKEIMENPRQNLGEPGAAR